MPETYRAIVDRDRCFSYAVCVESLPESFHLDDDEKSVPTAVPSTTKELLVDAAAGCPMEAISILDGDEKVVYP